MTDFRLRKAERLKRRKIIQALFRDGRSAFGYPIRIQWLQIERDGAFPARAAFSVPRKKFKRAVDRNLLKRRMREAYRLNKHLLYDIPLSDKEQLALMLIYTPEEILPFDSIQKGVVKALGKLTTSYHASE